eukprot:2872930-Lingulodinium_polyedra.AAC.1
MLSPAKRAAFVVLRKSLRQEAGLPRGTTSGEVEDFVQRLTRNSISTMSVGDFGMITDGERPAWCAEECRDHQQA